jgi:hypothetical protein
VRAPPQFLAAGEAGEAEMWRLEEGRRRARHRLAEAVTWRSSHEEGKACRVARFPYYVKGGPL